MEPASAFTSDEKKVGLSGANDVVAKVVLPKAEVAANGVSAEAELRVSDAPTEGDAT